MDTSIWVNSITTLWIRICLGSFWYYIWQQRCLGFAYLCGVIWVAYICNVIWVAYLRWSIWRICTNSYRKLVTKFLISFPCRQSKNPDTRAPLRSKKKKVEYQGRSSKYRMIYAIAVWSSLLGMDEAAETE